MHSPITDYLKNKDINKELNTVSFKKGEVILRPFEDTKLLYIITSGLVKIYSKDSRSKENIAVIYGPGDMFPLAWMIDQERPSVYFQAIGDCEVTLIPQQFFLENIKENTDLSTNFVRKVVEQFALYASTINNLGLKYGRERLAYRLLVLGARFGEKKVNTIVFPHISHSDLGATINMTRESITKEISRLEHLGVIEYSRAKITIKKPDQLQAEIGKNVPVIFFDNI